MPEEVVLWHRAQEREQIFTVPAVFTFSQPIETLTTNLTPIS